jgi:DNA-binding NtrC family response regulator
VNIAGLDDAVFSDTLFGHAKGAFTGADRERAGLIEKAADGTLFLDEIGDLSGPSQVKLLRLLQESEYLPLGSDSVKKSRARIVVATNEDIWKLQRSGKFRADLIYRLKTHHIHLPPLSERHGDLPLLVRAFINNAALKLCKPVPNVTLSAFSFLETYLFPGNIRELQGMVFDAVSRNEGGALSAKDFRPYCMTDHFRPVRTPNLKIDPDHSPQKEPFLADSSQSGRITFPEPLPTIREATDELVFEAMRRAGNNQTKAAALLGISQPALNKRLKTRE